MSYREPDFAGEIGLLVKQYTPARGLTALKAELATITAALATDNDARQDDPGAAGGADDPARSAHAVHQRHQSGNQQGQRRQSRRQPDDRGDRPRRWRGEQAWRHRYSPRVGQRLAAGRRYGVQLHSGQLGRRSHVEDLPVDARRNQHLGRHGRDLHTRLGRHRRPSDQMRGHRDQRPGLDHRVTACDCALALRFCVR